MEKAEAELAADPAAAWHIEEVPSRRSLEAFR